MNTPHPGLFTILIVDDDEMVRDLVAELLELDGHRILSAANGEAGLALAHTDRPDLVLVDQHMPVMSGLEVVQRLRADVSTRRIPIVAMTSSTAEDANRLSLAGCLAFIPKPFDPTEFRRLVGQILNETVTRTRRGDDPAAEARLDPPPA
jgi:two-component system cell cycle response regulator DivK